MAPPLAVEAASTVASLATTLTASVKVAIGSAPDTCHFSSSRDVEAPRLAAVQAAAPARGGSGPYSVRAVVADFEVGCLSGNEEESEEEKRDGNFCEESHGCVV